MLLRRQTSAAAVSDSMRRQHNRQMAKDAVDAAISNGFVACAAPCVTAHTKLVGAENYDASLYGRIAQHYRMAPDIAKHLV
jgi:azurin